MNSVYNPDVLLCLANLSNDEVFTPPELANDVLDLLPASLWRNREAKFLDPVSKSGVFLREIVKRLDRGLESQIPDRQKRIDHILANQVYGIAITELTALISRRSVYCSKYANGNYSIANSLASKDGQIKFEKLDHTWRNGSCIHCGASQKVFLKRQDFLDKHAYQFIHTSKPESIFKMKFDVIIGNPPYQLNDGGHGASAKPIYHKFVEQAIRLGPRYLSMITPSRWFSGGRVGELTDFRNNMLNDLRIRELHDFQDARDCFPGVEIKGGVSYFLWDRDNPGMCKVCSHSGKSVHSEKIRYLLGNGTSTFIRYNEAIPILEKIKNQNEPSFSDIVSANDPFGFDIRENGSMKRVKIKYEKDPFNGSVNYYYNGWRKEGIGYINRALIKKNIDTVDKLKLFVPKAIGTGNGKTDVIKPFIPTNPSCSSETYLIIGPFSNEMAMHNAMKYVGTKFFHFLVSLKKITQEARRGVYEFVPLQDFNHTWTDEMLFSKYGLTQDEIAFIQNSIHPTNDSKDYSYNE
jgi:site-specific DNA-methyltransferase (adenine-specific)